jgi:AMP nucleosidase
MVDFKKVMQEHTIQTFDSAQEAYERLVAIYDESLAILREELHNFCHDKVPDVGRLKEAVYPYLYFYVNDQCETEGDENLSYGYVSDLGGHGTTITHPQLFKDYLLEQIRAVIKNYQVSIIIGKSYEQIPLTYGVPHSPIYSDQTAIRSLKKYFLFPNLYTINDEIADDEVEKNDLTIHPISLFTAARTDYSLQRLAHYSGTKIESFQRFIILTNYQRYLPIFRNYCLEQLKKEGSEYIDFVAPGDRHFDATTLESYEEDLERLPQMPSYHLRRPDKNGITFINIGIGPTNAKNITDHLAVLRPHCWLMIGHCAGLRRRQVLGDYVLAQGYLRDDGVLDDVIPLWTPIPPLSEVQRAMQEAFKKITKTSDKDLKNHFRTGTVATTDDRNWEIRAKKFFYMLRKSRAIALDLESATIATNGFRYRVPYGALLCVSDKPLHGELKARGTAGSFYKTSLEQHLLIGLEAIEIMKKDYHSNLHSRKLRGYSEVVFR